MLVTTKEMLLDAQAGHYAVGAFNVESLELPRSFAPPSSCRPRRAP